MDAIRRNGREALLLFALAFALRLLPPLLLGASAFHERGYDYYVEMADHVLAGEGLYRTLPYGQGDRFAIRTPLYPLLLAGLRATPGDFHWKIAIAGALCGALTVVATRGLALRLFGPRAGLLAGLLAAAWPHAVVHDAALQDTAAYTALATWLALLTLDRLVTGEGPGLARAVATGLLGAAATLVRAPLLPTSLALVAWPALARRRVAATALAFVVLVLGLSPWLVRNARVIGAPVVTSDVGRSLWLGNNAQTFSVYPRQSIDRAEERAWAALPEESRAAVRALADDELAQDAWFRAEALRFMREHPSSALAGAARKAWATFSPWWNPAGGTSKQVAHLLAWLAVVPAAGLVAWRERARWRETGPLLVPIALLAAQSAVFFGHSSYRAVVDPLLIALASGLAVPPRRDP